MCSHIIPSPILNTSQKSELSKEYQHFVGTIMPWGCLIYERGMGWLFSFVLIVNPRFIKHGNKIWISGDVAIERLSTEDFPLPRHRRDSQQSVRHVSMVTACAPMRLRTRAASGTIPSAQHSLNSGPLSSSNFGKDHFWAIPQTSDGWPHHFFRSKVKDISWWHCKSPILTHKPNSFVSTRASGLNVAGLMMRKR